MAGKRVYGKVPKRSGIYCLSSRINSQSVRCVRRYKDGGKVKYLKSGNSACGCRPVRKSRKGKKR